MNEQLKNQYLPDEVSLPGDTLQEVLVERGLSQSDLAERTGRPLKTINEIIKGKAAITPDTAIQLEHVLDIPASFWINREQQYREAIARNKDREAIAASVDWLKDIPYPAMAKLGWVPRVTSSVEQVQCLLKFFGVASPHAWNYVWVQTQASFRQSPTLKSHGGAVSAWLRKGEIESSKFSAAEFNPEVFRETLLRIRKLTRDLPDDFGKMMVEDCRKAGVKVVFVPELPRTCTWGATRWITSANALIQLSLRYKTDDHLWFTFFHEAAHILLHGKRDVFVESEETTKSVQEREADDFARDFLIPEDDYKRFRRLHSVSCAAIGRFALELGIAPGIVVGRLQHDKALPRTHCNHLKKHFSWKPQEE